MNPALEFTTISDVGLRRSENQDRCIAQPEVGLFAVADGMGGLPFGSETAAAALDALARHYRRAQPTTLAQWEAVVAEINREVVAIGRQLSPSTGIGSTLSVAWFPSPTRLVTAQVGDSMILRLRAGKLEQLTHEHTVANRARRLREQGYEAAEPANAEHILTSCIGLEPLEEIDVREWTVQPGDRYAICSDGITKPVDHKSVAHALRDAANAKEAGRDLVRLALTAGGPDNATAVIVFVPKA